MNPRPNGDPPPKCPFRLTKIGVGNFRSLGEACVVLDLEKRVNVLIGPNNSGKSNVVKALQNLHQRCSGPLPALTTPVGGKPSHDLDRPLRSGGGRFRAVVGGRVAPSQPFMHEIQTDYIEITLEFADDGTSEPTCVDTSALRWRPQDVKRFAKNTHTGGGAKPTDPEWVRQTLLSTSSGFAKEFLKQVPKVVRIPEFRRADSRSDGTLLEGSRIAAKLADWRTPPVGADKDQRKFKKIEELVRRLLREDVRIEIPPRPAEEIVISLNDGNPRLPLESFGAGVHHLVVVATNIFDNLGCLICIEEPETSLHPRLQRDFLEFLLETEDGLFLLTTHSNSFLRLSSQVHVTHLRLDHGSTRPYPIAAPADALSALGDLGALASDLLQANCVIWVEGPSDRILVRRWLDLLAKERAPQGCKLREGIEYTFCCYASWPLLKHITLAREAPQPDDSAEFDLCVEPPDGEPPEGELDPLHLLPLLRINQNSILVLDRDTDSEQAPLRAVAQRILNECGESRIVAVVTHGREIENYLPEGVIQVTGRRPPVA